MGILAKLFLRKKPLKEVPNGTINDESTISTFPNKDIPEVSFSFRNDSITEEQHKQEISDLIKKRDELLKSMGYPVPTTEAVRPHCDNHDFEWKQTSAYFVGEDGLVRDKREMHLVCKKCGLISAPNESVNDSPCNAQNSTSAYCANCGSSLDINAVFCSTCGHKISRQTKQIDCNIIPNKANTEELVFGISECCTGKDLYCCVFHHPIKSAWITPTSYPVDYINIVSNEKFDADIKTYTDGESQIILRLIKAGSCDKQIVLDKKICYSLPMCDAMESWEFVFSNSPIVPEEYLEGYVFQSENNFACESDLLENKRRKERFTELW